MKTQMICTGAIYYKVHFFEARITYIPGPSEEPGKVNHTMAVDLEFRTRIASDWTTNVSCAHEARVLFMLIDIFVEHDVCDFHAFIQWYVMNRWLSAKVAADCIRHHLRFSTRFIRAKTMQIPRALFHGVIFSTPLPTSQSIKNSRLICISIQI